MPKSFGTYKQTDKHPVTFIKGNIIVKITYYSNFLTLVGCTFRSYLAAGHIWDMDFPMHPDL